MKKLFVIVICFLAFFVVGCSNKTTADTDLLSTTDDVYAFEAMSSITLLHSMNTASQQLPLTVKLFSDTYSKLGYNKDVTEDEINEINKYIGIMEQMLVDDKPISVVDEISDCTEYTNKLVISTKDITLNTCTYILYFNEVALNNVDDEENDEIESSLTGIMIVGDKEYLVHGKKEIEENEMEVEFTSKLDDNNWVTVKQEIEDDESKFKYTISENGVISVAELKFEQEDDETKLKLQFKQGENQSEYQFKIEEEDGQKVIKIEINNETTKLEVKVFVVVDSITGETSYEYRVKDSDKSFKKNRDNVHDQEDDDDDIAEDTSNETINAKNIGYKLY